MRKAKSTSRTEAGSNKEFSANSRKRKAHPGLKQAATKSSLQTEKTESTSRTETGINKEQTEKTESTSRTETGRSRAQGALLSSCKQKRRKAHPGLKRSPNAAAAAAAYR